MNLLAEQSWDLGQKIGQLRATPIRTSGQPDPDAILVAYSAVFDVDPFIEMFFFPEDTLHIALLDLDGSVRWKRDLGPGAVPGMWFSPFFAFDLDGDGYESIYTVLSSDPQHPLSQNNRVIRKMSPLDGSIVSDTPWINRMRVDLGAQWMGMLFRDFILGGHVHGEPMLVTAQGTYGDMYLRGFGPGMEQRWERFISASDPGARGSHMCPVLDWNDDGVDELLWGERLISLQDGREIWCADRSAYNGHSDIIQPVRMQDGTFRLFTAREGDPEASPRVVCFDADGERIFGDVGSGHMDMGWVARVDSNGSHTGMAIRIGRKSCGPDGRAHDDPEEFAWDLKTGEPRELPFALYGTVPVDLDGDGLHEFVYGMPGRDGSVIDREGTQVGSLGGTGALYQHLGPWPGEQVLCYYPDGTVKLWRDTEAQDSPAARDRYAHPAYRSLSRLFATGSNTSILAGV